jgi:predicted nucleic acid-binding protein
VGSLTLPSSGLVYLDTQALIYSVETHDRYWSLLEPVWLSAQDGKFEIVSSELALLETLIGPMRNGDKTLEMAYESLLGSSEVRLFPVTRHVMVEAARLRASLPSLRTPDAIHAATAQLHGCALFLTNDLGYRRVPNLPLAILDDVMSS